MRECTQLRDKRWVITVKSAPIRSDVMGSSMRSSFSWALYRPSRLSTSMTLSSRRASSREQFSWICDNMVTTWVMGASSGRAFSLARLVRRRPSEPTERTSKLPRLIECREPRGPASLVGPRGSISLRLAFGWSAVITMWVGKLRGRVGKEFNFDPKGRLPCECVPLLFPLGYSPAHTVDWYGVDVDRKCI